MLTKQEQHDCLQYNPFEGDFGSPGDRTLEDKIVVGRVEKPCNECKQLTVPGTHHRVMVQIIDDEMFHCRLCEECCKAMAAWVNGDCEPMEKRFALADWRAA